MEVMIQGFKKCTRSPFAWYPMMYASIRLCQGFCLYESIRRRNCFNCGTASVSKHFNNHKLSWDNCVAIGLDSSNANVQLNLVL